MNACTGACAYVRRMEQCMNKWCSVASALGIDELRRDAVRGKTVAIRIQGFRLILMMRHEPALEVFPFRDEKLRCGKVIQLVNLNAGCLDLKSVLLTTTLPYHTPLWGSPRWRRPGGLGPEWGRGDLAGLQWMSRL